LRTIRTISQSTHECKRGDDPTLLEPVCWVGWWGRGELTLSCSSRSVGGRGCRWYRSVGRGCVAWGHVLTCGEKKHDEMPTRLVYNKCSTAHFTSCSAIFLTTKKLKRFVCEYNSREIFSSEHSEFFMVPTDSHK